MYVCMYTNVIPHIYIYTYIPIHTHICYTYIYIHIDIWMYGCMGIWIYVHICIYSRYGHMYVYMDTWIYGPSYLALTTAPNSSSPTPTPPPIHHISLSKEVSDRAVHSAHISSVLLFPPSPQM